LWILNCGLYKQIPFLDKKSTINTYNELSTAYLNKKYMKKKHQKILTLIGAIILCILLLWWLFAATLIEEDEEMPTSVITEQAE
jgi:hypothetical protein